LTEKLPLLSGRKAAQAFVRLGWQVARQKGSHIVLVKPGHIASLSVPDHREVARGTLRSLLRSADVELDDFLKAVE
jgi:predicted RNA binding protein YcfA (HicA-like mRNA interferase family)